MNVETIPESEVSLKTEIAQLREELAKKKMQLDAEETAGLNRLYESGELEKMEKPEQAGWEDAPGLRKALRNMRGIDGIAAWYRYSRESFSYELLVETIMQGVWNDVRKSEKFDSGFKEEMRVKKRQYIMYSGDLSMGFDPNITKRLHAYEPAEMDELRKDANKRLSELGPKEYFKMFDEPYEDKEKKMHVSLASRYKHFIENYNRDTPKDPIADSLSPDERHEVLFKASQTMYEQVSQNLADNEFTLMPGSLRSLYVVMVNLEENQIQYYRDRDLDVKIPMVEFLIKQFRDEILGKRDMTTENAIIFTWFVNKAGQSFIPFENVSEDLKEWYEIIKALVGRGDDTRVQPSKFPKLQSRAWKGKGDESPVMVKINELRAKENVKRVAVGEKPLEPLTVDTQPFGRIGVGS